MADARIKDCVCDECARRMGYEPRKAVVGVWMGVCDFCGERRPLTSLGHDWWKKRKNGQCSQGSRMKGEQNADA